MVLIFCKPSNHKIETWIKEMFTDHPYPDENYSWIIFYSVFLVLQYTSSDACCEACCGVSSGSTPVLVLPLPWFYPCSGYIISLFRFYPCSSSTPVPYTHGYLWGHYIGGRSRLLLHLDIGRFRQRSYSQRSCHNRWYDSREEALECGNVRTCTKSCRDGGTQTDR